MHNGIIIIIIFYLFENLISAVSGYILKNLSTELFSQKLDQSVCHPSMAFRTLMNPVEIQILIGPVDGASEIQGRHLRSCGIIP